MIRHSGQWVDGIYKGGESRMRGVTSDLSFMGLMKLVEDVVGVNSEIDEIELHALISTPRELSRPIIKYDENVALILLEQKNVLVVYSVMAFSNENTTLEDNTATLEGDIATLEDNTASNEGNKDLFPSGETEPVGGVNVGDVQCDDLICNNPIADENGIRSPGTLLHDSYQEKENVGISRTWNIFSKAELKRALNMLALKEQFGIRVRRSCKARYEVGCKDKACKFSVCATKLLERGEYWQVWTFHKVHTCIVDGLQGRFAAASVKIIGKLMSHKLQAHGVALRPKDIIGEMRVQ
ncbi:Transposase [Theobroma cacao]|nr:Transposase [Theobroma cacao]